MVMSTQSDPRDSVISTGELSKVIGPFKTVSVFQPSETRCSYGFLINCDSSKTPRCLKMKEGPDLRVGSGVFVLCGRTKVRTFVFNLHPLVLSHRYGTSVDGRVPTVVSQNIQIG